MWKKVLLVVLPVLCLVGLMASCDGLRVPRYGFDVWNMWEDCLGYQTGNLLFVVDTAGGDGYCQVAITECVDTEAFVYEVHPRMGVVRRPFEEFAVEWYYKFDTNYGFPGYVKYFYLNVEFDRRVLLNRLTRLLNTSPDSIDGVALVHQCFERLDGRKIFNPSDTTLTQLVNSGLLEPFRIE